MFLALYGGATAAWTITYQFKSHCIFFKKMGQAQTLLSIIFNFHNTSFDKDHVIKFTII